MWKGLEVERADFFRARVEPEFQIFSIEPILQARILILLSNPNDLYPHLSLILHQIFYYFTIFKKFNGFYLVKNALFRLASLEKSSNELFKFRSGLFRA